MARPLRSVALIAVLAAAGGGGLVACGDDRPAVEIGAPGTDSGSGEPSGSGGGSGSAGTGSGGLARCGEILRAYGSLATTALQDQDAAANAQETLEGLAGELPDDLQDDLTVVADAFGTIAADGVVQGAVALTTSQFREANENILGYLRDDCLPS